MRSARLRLKAVLCALAGSTALQFVQSDAAADPAPDLRNLTFIPSPVSALPDADTSSLSPGGGETGDAQGSEASLELSIRDYQDAIRLAEDRDGPWAETITEQSIALASLYRRAGRNQEALAALDKAFHLIRVNRGLFDPTQIEVVRAMIETHVAMDDLGSANEKEQYLFYVQRKNYQGEDSRLLEAMIEWADWNVNMHLRERAYSRRPVAVSDPLQPRQPLISPRLEHAQDLYYTVIQWLTRTSHYEDPRLVTTERKLAALNYIVDQEFAGRPSFLSAPSSIDGYSGPEDDFPGLGSPHFHKGSDALKRAIAYSYNVSTPEYGSVAERIMELGDWYLLFDRRAAALETYEEALAVLSASSLSEQEIERIMTPGMPVKIPEISEAGASRSPPTDYKGYIDVEFTLSRFGLASRPAIIATSPGPNRKIERALLETIRDCKFRPKFVKGAVASDEKVRLRYYYTY